jgi:hypothetical protein
MGRKVIFLHATLNGSSLLKMVGLQENDLTPRGLCAVFERELPAQAQCLGLERRDLLPPLVHPAALLGA